MSLLKVHKSRSHGSTDIMSLLYPTQLQIDPPCNSNYLESLTQGGARSKETSSTLVPKEFHSEAATVLCSLRGVEKHYEHSCFRRGHPKHQTERHLCLAVIWSQIFDPLLDY
ncbi:hypothetical protein pdam_00017016 [Pocillopora damicornis]|uniref:Uncharacterized protein n=1 Tax=Pocillopora damicornis TaxID=46731 RepID=A0A3M6V3N0_POCDA|nr:hypothetical protein pdam_00017016 [Pocillopora damicornis]